MAKLKKPKASKRYPLVLYRRAADRIWHLTLPLGGLLGILWWGMGNRTITWLDAKAGDWLLVAAVLALIFTLFILVGRNLAYVQARADHILLVTPFLHLNISYRRVLRIHPVNFSSLFPPADATPAEKSQLARVYHQTGIVVELSAYPSDPKWLRLFLPREMFFPSTPGLVFLTPDWMAFSTDIDTLYSTWRQSKAGRQGFR